MGFIVSPSRWERDHAQAIFAGMRYEEAHGSPPDTPMWRMLERRHQLNPVRFDYWHPNIGLIFEGRCPDPRPDHHHAGPCDGPRNPWICCPSVPVACEPPHPPPHVTPEPPSWAMTIAPVLMFIYVCACVKKVKAERKAEGLVDGRKEV